MENILLIKHETFYKKLRKFLIRLVIDKSTRRRNETLNKIISFQFFHKYLYNLLSFSNKRARKYTFHFTFS